MIHRLFLRQYWVRTLGSFHSVVYRLAGSQRTERPMGNYHRPPHVRCGHAWVITHRHSEVSSDQFHLILLCHRTSQYIGHGGGSEYALLPPSSLGVGSE